MFSGFNWVKPKGFFNQVHQDHSNSLQKKKYSVEESKKLTICICCSLIMFISHNSLSICIPSNLLPLTKFSRTTSKNANQSRNQTDTWNRILKQRWGKKKVNAWEDGTERWQWHFLWIGRHPRTNCQSKYIVACFEPMKMPVSSAHR